MSNKHTPGPWPVEFAPDGWPCAVGPVELHPEFCRLPAADARLIVKAPEMYAFARYIADNSTERNAVAKACELLKQIDGGE